MIVKQNRIPTALLGACALLAASFAAPADALAQIPTTAQLYGVHETVVSHPAPSLTPWLNPFRDAAVPGGGPTLHAIYQRPDGTQVGFWGFYDGNGAGGMDGTVWKIRFMPDQLGTWTLWWWFSDGHSSGSGTFTVSDTGLPGPPRVDPNNGALLVDARGNPIHWRGYGIEHLGWPLCCDEPLGAGDGAALLSSAVDGQLIPKRYNATMVSVPTGWKGFHGTTTGTCNPLDPVQQQTDCPIWGNYTLYSLHAFTVLDDIIEGLQQRQIWTIGWITFALQQNWLQLKEPSNYQPLMRYFMARYGAFYNYFSWSPTWEIAEMGPQQGDPNWQSNLHQMMTYLVSIDPGYKPYGSGTTHKRLQGVHDQARDYWEGWQTILPRQQPSRSVVGPTGINGVNGNTRMAEPNNSAGWNSGLNYPSVIIGAEDIWEFCDGQYGKPMNRTQVRRGLVGGLFANVLPVYNELFSDGMEIGDTSSWPCDPDGPGGPLIGLGNGAGELDVRWWLDWWYGNVRYRDPQFLMLNGYACGTDSQICSGILNHEYVFYREGAGNLTVNLSHVSSSIAFDAWVLDVVNRAWTYVGRVNGGGAPINWSAPHAGDNAVFLRRVY